MLPEFLLLFLLGLRHGLDPDHIAVIDGLTLRFLTVRPRVAPWVGTLFAAGHGLVVTLIAGLVGCYVPAIAFPVWLRTVADWLPTALLLLVGLLNLRALLRPAAPDTPFGWRQHLVPARLAGSLHPAAAAVLTGVLFATVFDTATQVAAWGYAATRQGGVGAALLLGGFFSAGMILTDTLDGRLVCRLLQRPVGTALHQRYRRRLGWGIVGLSFGVAGYQLLSYWQPQLAFSDAGYSLIGLGLLGVVLGLYGWLWRQPALTTDEPA